MAKTAGIPGFDVPDCNRWFVVARYSDRQPAKHQSAISDIDDDVDGLTGSAAASHGNETDEDCRLLALAAAAADHDDDDDDLLFTYTALALEPDQLQSSRPAESDVYRSHIHIFPQKGSHFLMAP